MNKKGTHVDWVISMGIFVVYVFALFLFLRPGIKPVHKPVTLLNIVEEKFREDVMWEVKKVPLFIRVCSGIVEGGEGSVSNSITIEDANNCWSVSNVENPRTNEVFPNNELVCDDELVFKSGTTSLPFDFYFYKKVRGETCVPNFIFDCVVEDILNCDAEVGVAEEIRGIDNDALVLLKLEEYETLKNRWEDIPIGKEFAIFDDEGNYLVRKKPPVGIDVFVRKLTTQIVSRDGGIEPVGIFLQVW